MPDVENDGRNTAWHAIEANEEGLGAQDRVVDPASNELSDAVRASD